MNEIQIKWEGPFNETEIYQKTTNMDYGIYQVYGDHKIYGKNILLYIGKACEQTFGVRIPQHDDWFGWNGINMKYYIGRLGGEINISVPEWEKQIDYSESRLILECQTAWNSSGLNSTKAQSAFPIETTIINFGSKGVLPTKIFGSNWIEGNFENLEWLPYHT